MEATIDKFQSPYEWIPQRVDNRRLQTPVRDSTGSPTHAKYLQLVRTQKLAGGEKDDGGGQLLGQQQDVPPDDSGGGGGAAVVRTAPAPATAGAALGGAVGEGLLRVPRGAVAEGDGPGRGAQRRRRWRRRALGVWDDSGAVEALLAAKKRYWAEINGGLKVVAAPPPGPGMYCDEIVGEGGVDPELDAEYEAALRAMEDAWEENVRLREVKLQDDFVPVPTGWDVDG
jgi:hypothetical protein